MRIHNRFTLSICLSLFLLAFISLLFPESRVGSRLHKIAFTTAIDKSRNCGAAEPVVEKGLRLVVFGDSWVDNTIEIGEEGKGRSWTEVLCDEVRLQKVR